MDREYTEELLLDFGPEGKDLIPVITQNFITKEVLILAYANKEAFHETIRSNFATYFSRSRNELWKKGSTSGDFLQVNEIRINCEQNSLLFLVTPVGKGVCHALKSDGTAFSTCYYRRIDPDLKLAVIVN